MYTCKGKNKSNPREKENTRTGITYGGFFAFLKINWLNIIFLFDKADASSVNSG